MNVGISSEYHKVERVLVNTSRKKPTWTVKYNSTKENSKKCFKPRTLHINEIHWTDNGKSTT